MSWLALTEVNVLGRLADDERTTYEEAGEAEDNDSPRLPEIMVQVTALIRGAIEGNAQNYVGATGTIPPGSIYHAATLCRASLVGSQPTQEGETTVREREEKAAWDYIKAIQSKSITFASPVTPPVEASRGAWGGKELMDF
jgi:hypothetical protein